LFSLLKEMEIEIDLTLFWKKIENKKGAVKRPL